MLKNKLYLNFKNFFKKNNKFNAIWRDKYHYLNKNSKKTEKNMIIVKISDGLGNQLFQYAFGRNLAIIKNVPLKLDLSWFKEHNARKYELHHFNIVENFANDKEIKKIKKYEKMNSRRYFLHNYFIANEYIYIKAKQFLFDKDVFKAKKYAYLAGYWQTPKYFEGIEGILRKEFSLKNQTNTLYKKMEKKIKENNSISLHVRRTDYLTLRKINKIFGVCSQKYYKKAIQKISIEIKNPIFFIFSDDIKWAKENLKIKHPTVFVSDNCPPLKNYEELMLMSKCKHNIIANSTFSWWGAWLNKNLNKMVIAPQNWFKDPSKSAKDLIPESWTKL
jgi:hypothetical protein